MNGRRETLAAGALVALAVLLPFAPGILTFRSFYFRDLSLQFFPLRRFVVEGLRQGEVRWWNPFEHAGEPLSLPPVGYPLDLLQVLWPDERGFSLLLALHFPIAALACFALARWLGLGPVGAAGAGAVYALGGFALSSLNLYVYLHALAWAPVAVLGLLAAEEGGRRCIALGALGVALCFSTTGAEVVIQAVLMAMAINATRQRTWTRFAATLALGIALAAVPLAVMAAQVPGTARGLRFPTEVVLAHSVHPLTFLQVVVSGLYGETSRLAESWWGQNFFPRGFPYVLSLYLGPSVLSLALLGAAAGHRTGRAVAAVAAAGALVCLGRWAGWQVAMDALPVLRVFRYPTKAFFSVHFAAALLAGMGIHALAVAAPRWRRVLAWTAATAGLLSMAPATARAWPGAMRWFMAGFFPSDMGWAERAAAVSSIRLDAALGGAVAVCVAAVAVLATRGLRVRLAAVLVAGLGVADLLRAGAGLNPMTGLESLRPSPLTRTVAEALARGGARIFVCDVGESASYYRARSRRAQHEVWTLWAAMETLTPSFNVPLAVPSAYGPDRTMLVPVSRLLPAGEGCGNIGVVVERLREAGVGHVVSLDPLSHPDLTPVAVVRPERVAPLAVHVYALARPVPLRDVPGGNILSAHERPGRLEWTVATERPSSLVVRDAFAPGWTATIDGRPAGLERAEAVYRLVKVPAGRSRVVMRYVPPGLAGGAVLSAAALALVLLLLLVREKPAQG